MSSLEISIAGAFAVGGGSIDDTVRVRIVGPAGVLDRGKGMGRIAWEPVRSRLRPSESVPANGRPADQMPWPGWVLQPSGSAAKASTKSGGSRGPRKRNR